jgi:hypothetical protein
VDRVLAAYRVHDQSLTSARGDENRRVLQDRLRVLEKFYARPEIPPGAQAIRPLAWRNLYQDLARRHLTAGRHQEALGWYARSIRVAPDPLAAVARVGRDMVYHTGFGRTRLGVELAERWSARHARDAR